MIPRKSQKNLIAGIIQFKWNRAFSHTLDPTRTRSVRCSMEEITI
jgi:hypothetical protein